jgi:steroid 5-alpha reductase family enzyme
MDANQPATASSLGAGAAAAIVALSIAVGAAVAAGASDNAMSLLGVPLPWIAVVVAFVVQWIAFVPAYRQQTERHYDLIGSLTYLALVALALLGGARDPRSLLLGGLVVVWAVRLGSFLFQRVRRAGSDGRFDEIKRSAPRFLVAWTVQGLWVFVTLAAAVGAMTSAAPTPLTPLDALGALTWCLGFAIEVIADRQKSRFRASHPTGFIESGLWSWSRHPNYFGEILLWIGVAIIAASALTGWQWVTMISPVFVVLLLTMVSGVPLLEQRADARWGDDARYRRYKARTSTLVPLPPRRTAA